MTRFQLVTILAVVSALTANVASETVASLVGGTYTNTGAPATSWSATAPVSGSPIQYQTASDPTTGNVPQGFPNPDASASGAILSEIITPTTTFTLDTIAVEWAGAAPTPTGLSLHLYTLGTATLMPNLATQSNAFYFANTDLLGGGAGLPFFVNGVPTTSIVNFTFDDTDTSDRVTLNAETSYAIEFWNQTEPFNNNAFTWMRSSIADPGGQGFAKPSTSDFGTSRNTIAANGLAGGAPRTFYMALYGTTAGGIVGDYNQNGEVDAADYTEWRDHLDQAATPAGSGADGDLSGTIDAGDYTVWESAFGSGGSAAASAIPEPASLVSAAMAAIGAMAMVIVRRRAAR